MRYIADCFYLLAGLVLTPMVLYRTLRHGRYRRGWGQRMGRVIRRDPQRPCIWLHAVSMGETNAAQGLVTRLHQCYPNHEVVISATTDTGYDRASRLFGDTCEVFFFPLDLSWVMSRAFRCLSPCLCLLMELEVWPNFVAVAERMNVPVVVVNGRISDRSVRTYRFFRGLIRPTFSRLTLVLAQTDIYAQRFRDLGCPVDRVQVTGSLKYDTAQVTDNIPGAETIVAQLALTDSMAMWVAGGTGTGEEAIVLEAHRILRDRYSCSQLRLIIVPRKPERFDPVAQLIEQAGFGCQRYSPIKGGQDTAPGATQAIILGDTMGDLRKFYSLATVVFVGRSLVPMGGSDMMEAAALAKPILLGPYTHNFHQTVEALLAAEGALVVDDASSLAEAVHRCVVDVDFARNLGHRGREVIRANQGATERTLACLVELLEPLSTTA